MSRQPYSARYAYGIDELAAQDRRQLWSQSHPSVVSRAMLISCEQMEDFAPGSPAETEREMRNTHGQEPRQHAEHRMPTRTSHNIAQIQSAAQSRALGSRTRCFFGAGSQACDDSPYA